MMIFDEENQLDRQEIQLLNNAEKIFFLINDEEILIFPEIRLSELK